MAAFDADELDGDAALDGFDLVGHPDRAHAAFADLLEELVAADDEGAGGYVGGETGGWIGGGLGGELIEEFVRAEVGVEELLEALAQDEVMSAFAVEVRGALGWVGDGDGGGEEVEFGHVRRPSACNSVLGGEKAQRVWEKMAARVCGPASDWVGSSVFRGGAIK